MPVRQPRHRAAPRPAASGTGVRARPAARDGPPPPAPAGAAGRALLHHRVPLPAARAAAVPLRRSRGRRRSRRRLWPSGPSSEAKAAGWTAFAPSRPRARGSIRPRRRGIARPPLAPPSSWRVDTETNGCGGDECEMTEVGAVLVGGGELHDTWESLVQVERPLSRGIQRFTGITQGDGRRRAAARRRCCPSSPSCWRGACWSPTTRASTSACCAQAFERAGLDWPDPPVLCTVALARRFAPLVRKRGLASARRLARDRGRRGPPRAARRPHVRARVLRAVPEAVRERGHGRRRGRRCCARAAAQRKTGAGRSASRRTSAPTSRRCRTTPASTSSATSAGGRFTSGKSVSLRTRARAHFCAPAGWTERAEIVDYRPTNSELGALVLENRLIKQWKPAGQQGAEAHRPLVLPALPPRRRVPGARGRGRAGGGARGEHRTAAAAGRSRRELADQLTSLFRLRHCGRTLKLREHPSVYGQMGRCVSPCLGDLDPNAYRRQLDLALAHFEEPGAGEALLEEIDRRMRERRPRSATRRRRRCCGGKERLAWVLERLGGDAAGDALRAAARGGAAPGRRSASTLSGSSGPPGRLGPAAGPVRAGRAHRGRAVAPARPLGIPAEEVDEIRIVASWVAEHEPPALTLDPMPTPESLLRFSGSLASFPAMSA